MISIRFFDLNNSKPLLRRSLLLHRLPDGGKLRVSVALPANADFIVAKSNAKSKEIRRRSNQSISSLSENSQLTPKSNLSASPDLSSNRSSYCAPPEEWGDTEIISPRFLVLEGADDNDIEDYFNSTLSIREPVAEGQTVDDMDLPYFGYFLSRMPQLMSFVDLFPSIVGDVFARSLEHAALRHSILTIS